jgi:hypothetical protein
MFRDMLRGASGGGAVPVGQILHGVTEVAEQMPSVCHLHCIRCPRTNAVGISASTIMGDDLDTGMSAQPLRDCRCFAIR